MAQKFVPVIGVTVSNYQVEAAIQYAGGYPITYEKNEDIATWLDMCHGFAVPGGLDVNPEMYGETEHRMTACDPKMRRDLWERYVIRYGAKYNKPVLGICRGHQMLNVAMGGKLIQHIPQHWGGEHTFEVIDELWGLKTGIYEKRYRVNSIHHQAVDPAELGNGLEIMAYTGNIVEAILSTKHRFLVGIQSHPEMSYQSNPRSAKLFSALVRAATPKKILADRRRRAIASLVPEAERKIEAAINHYCMECGKLFTRVKQSALFTFLCQGCGAAVYSHSRSIRASHATKVKRQSKAQIALKKAEKEEVQDKSECASLSCSSESTVQLNSSEKE